MRLLTTLGITAALLFSGCGGTGTHVITGTITVTDTNAAFGVFEGVCILSSKGYSDISSGAGVTVKDGAGAIIGVSKLEEATTAAQDYCVWPFSVTVADADFYSIEVSHRGEVTYSRADLESMGWTLGLTLN
jgi:ABC-type uncharacterized transport system permease subunit